MDTVCVCKHCVCYIKLILLRVQYVCNINMTAALFIVQCV